MRFFKLFGTPKPTSKPSSFDYTDLLRKIEEWCEEPKINFSYERELAGLLKTALEEARKELKASDLIALLILKNIWERLSSSLSLLRQKVFRSELHKFYLDVKNIDSIINDQIKQHQFIGSGINNLVRLMEIEAGINRYSQLIGQTVELTSGAVTKANQRAQSEIEKVIGLIRKATDYLKLPRTPLQIYALKMNLFEMIRKIIEGLVLFLITKGELSRRFPYAIQIVNFMYEIFNEYAKFIKVVNSLSPKVEEEKNSDEEITILHQNLKYESFAVAVNNINDIEERLNAFERTMNDVLSRLRLSLPQDLRQNPYIFIIFEEHIVDEVISLQESLFIKRITTDQFDKLKVKINSIADQCEGYKDLVSSGYEFLFNKVPVCKPIRGEKFEESRLLPEEEKSNDKDNKQLATNLYSQITSLIAKYNSEFPEFSVYLNRPQPLPVKHSSPSFPYSQKTKLLSSSANAGSDESSKFGAINS